MFLEIFEGCLEYCGCFTSCVLESAAESSIPLETTTYNSKEIGQWQSFILISKEHQRTAWNQTNSVLNMGRRRLTEFRTEEANDYILITFKPYHALVLTDSHCTEENFLPLFSSSTHPDPITFALLFFFLLLLLPPWRWTNYKTLLFLDFLRVSPKYMFLKINTGDYLSFRFDINSLPQAGRRHWGRSRGTNEEQTRDGGALCLLFPFFAEFNHRRRLCSHGTCYTFRGNSVQVDKIITD